MNAQLRRWHKESERKPKDVQLINNKIAIKEAMMEKYGYLFCERCKESGKMWYEIHHIVYRSEAPNHEDLHCLANLIHVCHECHNWYHKKKENRNEIYEQRKLSEIFKFKKQ